jgi:hypothetical protein
MSEVVRIAMWSGPRNISTALMRSWEARGDTAVCDEPLYAFYLERTGRPHPGAEEIIERYQTDWRTVADWLTAAVPDGHSIFYQKHMAHHVLPEVELDWVDGLVSCFLIRDPREMIPSLAKVLPDPGLEETGLPQQIRILEHVRSRDVLTDPPGVLRALCAAIGVPWTDRMLHWAPGPRETDGIWAPHWYDAVERSTGFAPYRPGQEPVPPHLEALWREADALYRELHDLRITA